MKLASVNFKLSPIKITITITITIAIPIQTHAAPGEETSCIRIDISSLPVSKVCESWLHDTDRTVFEWL